MRTAKAFAPLAAAMLVACASTEVMQTGPTTFVSTAHESAVSGGLPKAQKAALAKATRYCAKKHENYQLLKSSFSEADGMAELTFTCLPQVAKRGRSAKGESAEVVFWESVKDSNDASVIQAYLDQYPKGQFAVPARSRIAALGQNPPPAPPDPPRSTLPPVATAPPVAPPVVTPVVDVPVVDGRRVALVIGNASYRHVPPLDNTRNDARLIAATLKNEGFELVGNGPALDLDRDAFAKAVAKFGVELQGSAVGVFYYAGHGVQVQGTNFLVPVDASPVKPSDADLQMIDVGAVLHQMEDSGAKLKLVMLDACRNNPFLTRGLRDAAGGLAQMRAPEGTIISYATQPGNVARDGDAGGDSPYATALVQAMRHRGIEVLRMFNEVGLQVDTNTGHTQQPWTASSPISGDFYFAGR